MANALIEVSSHAAEEESFGWSSHLGKEYGGGRIQANDTNCACGAEAFTLSIAFSIVAWEPNVTIASPCEDEQGRAATYNQ